MTTTFFTIYNQYTSEISFILVWIIDEISSAVNCLSNVQFSTFPLDDFSLSKSDQFGQIMSQAYKMKRKAWHRKRINRDPHFPLSNFQTNTKIHKKIFNQTPAGICKKMEFLAT